jgi:uncharacterized membrane protein YkvA (DUF1232 family)
MNKLQKRENSKIGRREKSQFRLRMEGFLMFLPNMVILLGKLLKDARVPMPEKALFLAAIVYVVSPIDLIPDIFPFIGQVDDIYLVALTLLRLINRTEEDVVRENWPGGGDIVGLANMVAGIAPKFLPKRVSRVLSAEVELPNAGQAFRSVTEKRRERQAASPERMSDDR